MKFVFDGIPTESPFVESIWHTHSEVAGTFMSQAITTCEMVVMRHQGRTQITLRGPETVAMIADCPADAEFFGIQFKLGTYMPHLPTPSLVDTNALLPEAAGNSFWLQGAAWEFPEFDNADAFV